MHLCQVGFILSSLTDAYNAVIQACNSPLISYNQLDSDKPTRETIHTYYNYSTNNWTRAACCDCSSLMGWALYRGGYSQSFFACDTIAMWEYYMARCGWTDMGSPSNNIWMPGDILQTRDTHTEMVYQGNGGAAGITMGAIGRWLRTGVPRPLDDQVLIYSGLSTYSFTKLWRDTSSPGIIQAEWHQINNTSTKYYVLPSGNLGNDAQNAGFPLQEQLENMIMIVSYLRTNTGASNACIAGILGNIIYESTLNPNCWQLTPGVMYGGYGLVQFDPPTKYIGTSYQPSDYATNAESNGNAQMALIVAGIENSWASWPGEWAPSYTATDTGITYNYTKNQFYALTDPEEACLSFLWQYERPSAPATAPRLRNARWVYDNMSQWGNAGIFGNWSRPTGIQTFLLADKRRKGYYR